jgi:hypothetical protein
MRRHKLVTGFERQQLLLLVIELGTWFGQHNKTRAQIARDFRGSLIAQTTLNQYQTFSEQAQQTNKPSS